MTAKILVVDDEDVVRDVLYDILGEDGYDVVGAADGQEGLRAFFAHQPALVVLDVRMPRMDGWELLSRIREVSETPVIMLSALAREPHAVRGLRGGADDYMVKPVRAEELCARVGATLRRCGPTAGEFEDVYHDAVLRVDFPHHQVHLRGTAADLSAQEFRVLTALVRNAGVVLSADRLLDLCWPNGIGAPENVRVYIGYLRKKLEEEPKRPVLIQTVKEFGYRYQPQDGAG